MNAKEIAQKAIEILNKKITNEVFLTIQNNRPLMLEYLRAVESNRSATFSCRLWAALERQMER